MAEIKVYLLEKKSNGRNRYLISTYNFMPLRFLFFNGTRKKAFEVAYILRDRILNELKGGLS